MLSILGYTIYFIYNLINLRLKLRGLTTYRFSLQYSHNQFINFVDGFGSCFSYGQTSLFVNTNIYTYAPGII